MAQGAVERMEAAKKEEEAASAKADSMDVDENKESMAIDLESTQSKPGDAASSSASATGAKED